MASQPIEQLSATYLGKKSSELEPEELRVLNSLHTQTPLARDAVPVLGNKPLPDLTRKDITAALAGTQDKAATTSLGRIFRTRMPIRVIAG